MMRNHKGLKFILIGLLSMLMITGVGLAQDAAWTTPPPISNTVWAAGGKAVTLPPVVKSEIVPINGIQMFYVTYGDPANPPLLLLHGGLTNGDSWVNQIADFAKSYYVVIPDNRGQGRSTIDDQPFSIHLEATDDLALLDTLKIDAVDLVGWSDGANVGLDIAVNHPERLNKLVAYGGNYLASGAQTMDEVARTSIAINCSPNSPGITPACRRHRRTLTPSRRAISRRRPTTRISAMLSFSPSTCRRWFWTVFRKNSSTRNIP